jgi:arginine/serine-rich splicing factor 16
LQKDESDSDVDMDVSIDITKIQTSQAHELNSSGRKYGMVSNDFYSFLTKDYDEAESLKIAKQEEAEKIMLVGRKSRRERRAQREKKYLGRPMSPPSYAAKEEKNVTETYENDDSRSPSPENSGKITYITSFGGEDEMQPHSKISITLNKPAGQVSYADKVKENLERLKKLNSLEKLKEEKRRARSRSESRRKNRRSRSYTRSRSKSSYRHQRRRTTSSNSSRSSWSRSRTRKNPKKSRTRSRSPVKRRASSSSSTTSSSESTSSSSDSSAPKKRNTSKSSSSTSSTPDPKYKTSDKSKSKTPPVKMEVDVPENPAVALELPVKRYYGRKREDESSSDLSVSENEADNRMVSNERFAQFFELAFKNNNY